MGEADTDREACVFYYNGQNLPDYHRFDIPVEWRYDSDENIGGDYAKAALVLVSKKVTKLRCVCGAEKEI